MDEQTKQMFIAAVTKVVSANLASIVNAKQGVIAVGEIVDINYTGHNATVQISNSSGLTTTTIPYPFNYSETEIGIGQKAVIVSPDPSSPGTMFIVAAYGSF